MKCTICENENGNKSYLIPEMMFGSGEFFEYFQCRNCHCLQILKIPNDISRFYESSYYSYKKSNSRNSIVQFLTNLRNSHALFGNNPFGYILGLIMPSGIKDFSFFHELSFPINRKTRILDIGCGAARLLYSLSELGFKNILGIDPFISENINYKNGLTIKKADIHNIPGEWDLITFHHSFEHMPEQLKILKAASSLLSPAGQIVIRIPIVSSYAWHHYGVNWVQADAPRHLFLHSVESIKYLTELAGMRVDKIIYDSSEFQFWGSEQYMRGISLFDKASYLINKENSIFSESQIQEFRLKATQLNRTFQGDQAIFYLTPVR